MLKQRFSHPRPVSYPYVRRTIPRSLALGIPERHSALWSNNIAKTSSRVNPRATASPLLLTHRHHRHHQCHQRSLPSESLFRSERGEETWRSPLICQYSSFRRHERGCFQSSATQQRSRLLRSANLFSDPALLPESEDDIQDKAESEGGVWRGWSRVSTTANSPSSSASSSTSMYGFGTISSTASLPVQTYELACSNHRIPPPILLIPMGRVTCARPASPLQSRLGVTRTSKHSSLPSRQA